MYCWKKKVSHFFLLKRIKIMELAQQSLDWWSDFQYCGSQRIASQCEHICISGA